MATSSGNLPSPISSASEADGTRERLRDVALRLFSRHGYAATPIRRVAEAARANVAAIHYHFGDKAGLYRSLFDEPGACDEHPLPANVELVPLLHILYGGLLAAPGNDEAARCRIRLRIREMLEPTGLGEAAIQRWIKPMHEALVTALRRHLGLPRADADLQRLALCLESLAMQWHLGRGLTSPLSPLLDQPIDPQAWTERLCAYALAMVEAEARRRTPAHGADAAAPPTRPPMRKKPS